MIIERRGVVPVIGVVLMIILTMLLASAFASGTMGFGTGIEWNFSKDDAASLTEPGPGSTSTATSTVTTLAGNPWSGSRGDLLRLSNNTAGAVDVTYRVNFTIEPGTDSVGDDLEAIYLEVTTGSPDMFSNTELGDLQMAGVDNGSNGTIDRELTNDADEWYVHDGGTAMEVTFETDYENRANDSIIVEFNGVKNPNSAGDYDVRARTDDDDFWHNGTITIVE